MRRLYRPLSHEKPDIILVRFWIPFMGPALGTILRLVKRNKYTRIIGLTDNVVPHEKRPGDTIFTRYFLGSCHAFIAMSEQVMSDLRTFEKKKPGELLISTRLMSIFKQMIKENVVMPFYVKIIIQ